MEMGEFQKAAQETDQNAASDKSNDSTKLSLPDVIPILGLAGEVGSLLSEYKKLLRDGEIYRNFRDEVAEELGDLLWYVANVAEKYHLNMDEIAIQNLRKVRARWLAPIGDVLLYDEHLPYEQQLPRQFAFRFDQREIGGVAEVRVWEVSSGSPTGDPINDNTYEDDGYRFHDVIHLAFAAQLGWSPVLRKMLRDRRRLANRTPQKVDVAEDGGRAQIVEEAIVAAAYIHAEDHAMLEGATTVGHGLLRHIQRMTRKLEVAGRSAWEWDRALLSGFSVWRELFEAGSGTVSGNLEKQSLEFSR